MLSVTGADGTWTDIPRCIEHEPGEEEQKTTICPGIPGYCALNFPGGRCNFVCPIGPNIRSRCTYDGTWEPYPTCLGDIRETQDGCNPCPGPNGGPRNRTAENLLGGFQGRVDNTKKAKNGNLVNRNKNTGGFNKSKINFQKNEQKSNNNRKHTKKNNTSQKPRNGGDKKGKQRGRKNNKQKKGQVKSKNKMSSENKLKVFQDNGHKVSQTTTRKPFIFNPPTEKSSA